MGERLQNLGIPSIKTTLHFIVFEAVLELIWWGVGKVTGDIPGIVQGWGYLVVFVAGIFAVAWYLPKLPLKFGGASKPSKEEHKDKPLTQVIGQKYLNTTIILDWHEYINCEFENCTLHWDGNKYALKDCSVTEGKIVFATHSRAIADTVSLLKHLTVLKREFADTWQQRPPEYFKKDKD